MRQTADHLIVMGRGRIVAEGPIDEVIAQSTDTGSLEDAYLALTADAVEYRSATTLKGPRA